VIAEAGYYLEEIVIGINVFISILIVLDPLSLLLRLIVLQVELQEQIGILRRDML
jgi:hypothetical protein